MNGTLKTRELEVSALKEELNKAHDDIRKRGATMKVTSIVQLPCDPLGLYALCSNPNPNPTTNCFSGPILCSYVITLKQTFTFYKVAPHVENAVLLCSPRESPKCSFSVGIGAPQKATLQS